MSIKLIREKLNEDERKAVNHFFKLQMRLSRHGSIDIVNKPGRKAIGMEQKLANRRKYYQEVIKPRREAEKQEKIKNGTYVVKKSTGRPRKNKPEDENKEKEELINKILNETQTQKEKKELVDKILKLVSK